MSSPSVDHQGKKVTAPAVSVIIPAHNPGVYLEQAIESVHGQTFEDWEIVVIDDGSTEDISSVCSKFSRVTLIRQEQSGSSIARNVGILKSCGEFIAFLDHDDLWQPTKLEKQMAALNLDNRIGICHTDVAFIDWQGNPIYQQASNTKTEATQIKEGRTTIHALTDPIHKSYRSSGILTCSSVAIRRSALASGGLFDPDLNICGDTDLWLKICLHHKLVFVPTKETIYRLHKGNLSKNSAGPQELERLWKRYEAYRKRTGNGAPALVVGNLKAEAPGHLAAQQFDHCRESLRKGDVFTSAGHLIRALNLAPRFVAGSLLLWAKRHLSF
jgi:glycosyltransferase involved in cell wall biosynthesis